MKNVKNVKKKEKYFEQPISKIYLKSYSAEGRMIVAQE